MKGISKKRLEEIAEDYPPDHRNHRMAKYLIATECQELQEPWMTLDEFLKSGFEGWCWIIETDDNQPSLARYNNDDMFVGTSGFIVFDEHNITHVMPIHKPEPPR